MPRLSARNLVLSDCASHTNPENEQRLLLPGNVQKAFADIHQQ